MSVPPPYVAGHGLLAGKSVLVTAAAGTGIGFSAATRCAEEGAAAVVLSDRHERRLAESVEALSAAVPACKVFGVPCDVTVQADVDRLFDRAAAGDRWARRGDQQRRPRRHRRPGRHDRRAVVRRARRDPERHVSLHPGRPAAHAAARARRDRQQRVGARLAGPGRPGPLRGGQGRRHGPDPLRGDRGGARRACGSTRWRRAWPCTRFWPRSPPTSCWPS